MNKLRILYIGDMNPSSNSYKRLNALKEMGILIKGIDIHSFLYKSIFSALHYRFNFGPGIHRLNRKVLTEILSNKWDILWVDNKPYLTPKTLCRIRENNPHIKIVNIITDDPNGKYGKYWGLSRKTAEYYDWHFVQRPENIDELKLWGAQRVDFCFRSFDPNFHRPLDLTGQQKEKYHTSVGFVGSYEEQREEYIAHLIENGVSVKVIGDGWPGKKYWSLIKSNYYGPSVWGEEYIRVINGMDIALHFLRHANRDQQDSRTFEIPACGTFMLAEWSPLHEQFFEEGKEAVFFRTKDEILQLVKFYTAAEKEREQIALGGRQRCLRSGYDHQSRLKEIIGKVISE